MFFILFDNKHVRIASLVKESWHQGVINVLVFTFFPQIVSDFLTNDLTHCLEIETKRCPMAKLGLYRDISTHLLNKWFTSKKANIGLISKQMFDLIIRQPFSIIHNFQFNIHKFLIS